MHKWAVCENIPCDNNEFFVPLQLYNQTSCFILKRKLCQIQQK
jgi:hypothetical protein